MSRLGVRHWLRIAFVAVCAVAAAATSRMPCPWYVQNGPQEAGCATLEIGAKRNGREGTDILLVVRNHGESTCAVGLRSVSIERGGTTTPSPAELSLAPDEEQRIPVHVTTDQVYSDGDPKPREVTIETDQGTLHFTLATKCGGCMGCF